MLCDSVGETLEEKKGGRATFCERDCGKPCRDHASSRLNFNDASSPDLHHTDFIKGESIWIQDRRGCCLLLFISSR